MTEEKPSREREREFTLKEAIFVPFHRERSFRVVNPKSNFHSTAFAWSLVIYRRGERGKKEERGKARREAGGKRSKLKDIQPGTERGREGEAI